MSDQLWWLLSIFGWWFLASIIGAIGYSVAARRQDRRRAAAYDDTLLRVRRGLEWG